MSERDRATPEQLQRAAERYILPRKCVFEYPVVLELLRDKLAGDNYIKRLESELRIAERYAQQLQQRLHKLEKAPKLELKPETVEVASGTVGAN